MKKIKVMNLKEVERGKWEALGGREKCYIIKLSQKESVLKGTVKRRTSL